MISLGSGKCSSFGGALDTGVGPLEGLGCIEQSDLNQWWFRRLFVNPGSWDNSKGLARNLDPNAFYCAMRWEYTSFDGIQGEILTGLSREQIRHGLVRVTFAGRFLYAQPADFGPNLDTGRLIDLSPGCLLALGAKTDDIVSVDWIS